MTCNGVNDDTFVDGETQEFQSADKPNAQSADVVFIVEEKQCNAQVVGKLADMGVQIDNALKAQGKYLSGLC